MQSTEKNLLNELAEEIARLRRKPGVPRTRQDAAAELACARCGEAASSALIPFGQSWRERVLVCRACYPIIRRAMSEPEYQLTEADRERARQEIEERAQCAGRLETETLVIDGNHLRFKTPKEFAAQYTRNRMGMPESMSAALAARDAQAEGREKTAGGNASDDPFGFGGDMH